MTDTIGFSNRARDKLSGAINNSQTFFTLATGGLMPASGKAFDVTIDLEYIRVPAASNTGGPTYTSVLRGRYGSIAVSHADQAGVIEILTGAELDQFVQTTQLALSADNDVAISGLADGDYLGWDAGASKWKNKVLPAGTSTLAGDTDVSIVTPLNGDVLTFDTGTGRWKNVPVSADTDTLASGTDVTIAAPANNDILTYETSSGKWKNKPASGVADAAVSTVGVVEVDHAPSGAHPVALTTDGAHHARHEPNGADSVDWAGKIHMKGLASGKPVSSVNNTGCYYSETDTGNTYRSDGSAWLLIAVSTGGSASLAGDTDVSISSPANNDVLTWETATSRWKNKVPAAVADATTSAVGVLEVDHAPTGAHPIALTTDGQHASRHLPGAGDPINFAGVIHMKGLASAKPAAAAANSGCYYSETDTGNTYRSDGSAWLLIAITSGGGGSSTLAGDTDVSIATPSGRDALFYDPATSKWTNKPETGARSSIFARSSYANVILGDSPKVYIRFGDPVGATRFRDLGSLGYDGVYVNTPTLGVSGAVGDGDTAISCPNAISAQTNVDPVGLPLGATARSTEIWFRWRVTTGANLPVLLQYGTGDVSGSFPGGFTSGQDWIMELNSDPTKLGLATDANDIVWQNTSINTADGVWHHFVVTFDGTNATPYLDGVLFAAAQTFPSAINTQIATGRKVCFGDRDGGAGHNYTGDLDEAAIYNYALTAAQVAAHYTAAQASQTITNQRRPFTYRETALQANPVAYWAFEETALGTVIDSTGNGNNLTSNNSAVPNVAGSVFGSAGFHFTGGGFGFSGQLSGTGVRMPLATDPGLSYAGWFKIENTNLSQTVLINYGNTNAALFIDTSTATKLGFFLNGTEVVVQTATDLRDNAWHHLAAATDAKGVVAWVDGVKQGGFAVPPGSGAVLPSSVGTIVFGLHGGIGSYQANLQGGCYDEVAVYARMLGDAEVQALYASRTRGIFESQMQAVGDMIQGDVNGRAKRTAIGANARVWTSDGTSGSWQPPTGVTTLAADTDVSLTSPANNDALVYDSTASKWKNKPLILANDADVVIATPANNDILTYETSSGKWKNKPAAAGGSSTLAGDSDVSVTGLAEGDTLVYDALGASKWVNVHPGTAGKLWTSNGTGALPSWQAITVTVTTVTANYTVLTTDGTIVVNAASKTVTLPAIATVPTGQHFRVRNRESGSTTTVIAAGGALISGQSSDASLVNPWSCMEYESDGTQYLKG